MFFGDGLFDLAAEKDEEAAAFSASVARLAHWNINNFSLKPALFNVVLYLLTMALVSFAYSGPY